VAGEELPKEVLAGRPVVLTVIPAFGMRGQTPVSKTNECSKDMYTTNVASLIRRGVNRATKQPKANHHNDDLWRVACRTIVVRLIKCKNYTANVTGPQLIYLVKQFIAGTQSQIERKKVKRESIKNKPI